jgi:uncharacterized protein (DUF2141 family)
MKTASIIICVLLALGAYAQELKLNVKNIENSDGFVMVDVYDSKKHFLKKPLFSRKIEITGKEVQTVLSDLKPGIYAIGVYHDQNGNGNLDTNIIGIPKEPIGTSNNAVSKFGPPKFEDAKFSLESGEIKNLTINF